MRCTIRVGEPEKQLFWEVKNVREVEKTAILRSVRWKLMSHCSFQLSGFCMTL